MPAIGHTRQICPFPVGECACVESLPFATSGQSERWVWVAWIPIVATVIYYLLPKWLQGHLFMQFAPQLLGYCSLLVWSASNDRLIERLGLAARQFFEGLRWGCITGFGLGGWNLFVILVGIPWLGGDIDFLKDTPHARMPFWIMVPWGILTIAYLVELNFRGFLLGRLAVDLSRRWTHRDNKRKASAWARCSAVILSALTFAFDPFMVTTFRHLHWIAVWDGLVWGWIYVRTWNLYTVIVAHAVEVMVLYLGVRAALL